MRESFVLKDKLRHTRSIFTIQNRPWRRNQPCLARCPQQIKQKTALLRVIHDEITNSGCSGRAGDDDAKWVVISDF
ncbi:hypothetical protein KCP77_13880 [Salmonella enterica subsp. enterica]|nr:hypothetical protein KCP77_13880 [Salmonella enterica subsp. enterica]